jgi:hypothetical protein
MSANATMPSTEIIAAPPLVPMAPDAARQAMADFQAFTAAMLVESDWQQAPGIKPFVKRSGWRKIATGYTLSCEILEDEVLERDERGEPTRARAKARVFHRETGRSWEGTGRCSTTEPRFRRGDTKAEHDVTATAVTRAINRATSDLVGFGQVSAEEVDGGVAVDAVPALDDAGLRAVAAALGERWPEFDSFRFLNSLIKRYDGAVPEAAGVALRAWARFARHTPAAQGNEREAGSQSPTDAQTTTTSEG